MHTTTLADVNDLDMATALLLYDEEHTAFGDTGYQDAHRQPED
jgi:hypothetical protein